MTDLNGLDWTRRQDVHDLFATLMVSLDLRDHRQFFKLYSYSFTTYVPPFLFHLPH